jgi:hypothetical protein
MSIVIEVSHDEINRAKKLGAQTTPDEKIWYIPDKIKNINPFKRWLPRGEGFYVQKPYSLARSRMPCYNCNKITPIIALSGRVAQEAEATTTDNVIWRKLEFPVYFSEITYLDPSVDSYLQENYPFFKLAATRDSEQPIWGNTCIHCGFLIDDHDEFKYECHALNPLTIGEIREIRVVYFDLPFDYYIRAGWYTDPIFNAALNGRPGK